VDNEITRLTDSVNLLHMHLMIVDHLVKQLKQNQFTGGVVGVVISTTYTFL
jgi:hypothetical protein